MSSDAARHWSAQASAESAGWVMALDLPDSVDPAVQASLLALSCGIVGIRGADDRAGADRFLLVEGAFGAGTDGLVRPLPGPACTVVDETLVSAPCRWVLDLRRGTVERMPGDPGGLRSLRFASIARPGVVALRAEDDRPERPWAPPLAAPTVTSGSVADFAVSGGAIDDCTWLMTESDRAHITVVAGQRVERSESRRRLERVAMVCPDDGSSREEACGALETAAAAGFDELCDEHGREWERRWADADIEIDGDPVAQLAIRFALFHLLSCAPTSGAAAVGARGLTGLAYAGHVFWDTDVYVLPVLAGVLPDAARAIVGYRTAHLAAARDEARRRGMPGARYPWESADAGRDVTPRSAIDLEGHVVPIRTGQRAEHINADIAWAVHRYVEWTGEHEVLDGAAGTMVRETAQYWRARIRHDSSGRGHLYGVIGPDEYHEVVDDNAYTNVLARWHLRWAAELARGAGDEADAEAFEAAADALVDNFDPATGRHEQFAGFWDLEPLLIGEVASPPVAADVLLGRDRVKRAQVIKQPDVLMLHHLVPDECPPGSLTADLDSYLPRTAHGSSLSPAINASLLARDGRPDEAMELFDLAARIDLDDLTDTTAGGLHLATMGGLWQAVVQGFAGIRPTPTGLCIDPCLPSRWTRCSIRLRYRGARVRVTITPETVEVESDDPATVVIGGRVMTTPARVRLPLPCEETP